MSVLSLGTALWLVAVSSENHPSATTHIVTALIAVTFLSFLLRQRVSDEFKDRGHDDENYPQRPVQRGAIQSATLIVLGSVAAIVEISAVLTIAAISGRWLSPIAYLGVAVYSALTAVEFFVPNWLQRRYTLYFLSHQVIFLFFALWGWSIFTPANTENWFAGVVAFVAVMAALEIMRKIEIRRNGVGEIVPDTYSAVWGRPLSIGVIVGCFLLAGSLLAFGQGILSALLGVATGLGIVAARKSDATVQSVAVVGFLALGIPGYFA